MMTKTPPPQSSIQRRHPPRIRAEFGSLDRWTNMSASRSIVERQRVQIYYKFIVALVIGPIHNGLAVR